MNERHCSVKLSPKDDSMISIGVMSKDGAQEYRFRLSKAATADLVAQLAQALSVAR